MHATPPASARTTRDTLPQSIRAGEPLLFSYVEMDRDSPQVFMLDKNSYFFSSLNTSFFSERLGRSQGNFVEVSSGEMLHQLGRLQNPPRLGLRGRVANLHGIFDTHNSGFLINNQILGDLVSKLLERANREEKAITQRVEFNSLKGIVIIQISGPYLLREKATPSNSISDIRAISFKDQIFPDFGSVSAILKPGVNQSSRNRADSGRHKKSVPGELKLSTIRDTLDRSRGFNSKISFGGLGGALTKQGEMNLLDPAFQLLNPGRSARYMAQEMHYGGEAQYIEDMDLGLDSSFPLTNQFSQPTVSSFNGQCPYFVNEKQYDAIIRRRKKKQKKMLLYGMTSNL